MTDPSDEGSVEEEEQQQEMAEMAEMAEDDEENVENVEDMVIGADDDEEEDPRTPLLMNPAGDQSRAKTPSFNEMVFTFPSVVKRSILKNSSRDTRLNISNAGTFLTVPTAGVPLPSPVYSTSTPSGIPLSFFGKT